jgi:hypothetical protein
MVFPFVRTRHTNEQPELFCGGGAGLTDHAVAAKVQTSSLRTLDYLGAKSLKSINRGIM